MGGSDNARGRQGFTVINSNASPSWSIDVAEVLRGLTGVEAEAVLKTTEDRTYANGASIFSAGDPQTGICLVKQGLVEEFRLTESGAKLPISRVGTGKLLALASVRGRYC